ncbi:hypothetical protein DFP78_10264 [Photobacterium lutimaris]|nr:hypothetical protein DFP78_10264 [Photobacterium lutimaris]
MQHQEMINPTHTGIITRTIFTSLAFMVIGLVLM